MENYVPRLKKVYKEKIAPELFKELGYTSTMQIPAIKKDDSYDNGQVGCSGVVDSFDSLRHNTVVGCG